VQPFRQIGVANLDHGWTSRAWLALNEPIDLGIRSADVIRVRQSNAAKFGIYVTQGECLTPYRHHAGRENPGYARIMPFSPNGYPEQLWH
jgi:hypothetical protein